MTIGLPDISIAFKQKAVTAITRSERGIAAVIVADASVESGATVTLMRYASEIPAGLSEDNKAALNRCFLVAVNKVYVIAIASKGTFADAQTALEAMPTPNYVCSTVATHQADLAAWIKTSNTLRKGKKVTGVVFNAVSADDMHIVNVKNPSVQIEGKTVAMPLYLPRITSMLANLALNRSSTFFTFEELEDVDVAFVDRENTYDSWINKGFFVLMKDEGTVRVGRGVNSLVTFTTTETEDMRKIAIVEGMDLIREDVYQTFKDYYVGKYKNSLDNQYLFITSVNAYFRELTKLEVLDPTYDNHAAVDVESQRNAWAATGKAEALDWTDEEVEKMSFKSTVFLAGQVKILDAIEDLKFTITME